ncbi:sensor histidine kinase [Ilumatobacter nonamiensis]|uniref:sensor histidine kinase n=1 Tax=Ilumatobacter nonamiensis TaxID=467093 RepID=UPI000344F77E|nr:PAS domain-containing protein [Ilumatobacter nonamiensis]
MSSTTPSTPASNRSNEVRDMYAALLQGELSGEEALAASEQMLKILMDSMSNAVFWKDLNSQFVGCNQAFSDFAGFEPALLLGKSDRDMPWADDNEFSSDWFIDWDKAVMESGEPRFGILERLRRADGVVTWIETNKVPLRDLNGEVIGLLGAFKDVTDVHLAQEELKRTLDDLDARVQRRTAEIERANEALRREVDDRIRSQAQERQQRTYAETLRDTAASMSQTFDLESVTEQALGGVERLVSNDLAAILLATAEGTLDLSRHLAGFGYLDVEIEADAVSLEELTVVQRLAGEAGPVIIDHPPSALGPARCVLGARMRVADQLVGYLIVESATPGFYNADHAERLAAVADQAGAVLSNARLAQRVSELAAAEERQRLARDLHDAVNQSLWTAALSAESLLNDIEEGSDMHQRVDRLRQLTRGALSEMRELLLELRPAELAEVQLRDLIEHLVNALEGRRRIDVTVDLQGVKLEPAVNIALYRIAQQALSNMAQHSNATALDVRLHTGPPVVLRVADNGDGFDENEVPSGHLGLQIMRERAEAIGAELVIESGDDGTTVTVTVAP